MTGKLSAKEVEEIRRELNYLRKFQAKKSEEETNASLEEFFGE